MPSLMILPSLVAFASSPSCPDLLRVFNYRVSKIAAYLLRGEMHVDLLTPFLGTCLGWQDKVAVRCLQSGLPMREKLNVTKSTGSNMVPMAR